jgi:hypothetical protein
MAPHPESWIASSASLLAMTEGPDSRDDASWLTVSFHKSKDATGFAARSLEIEVYSSQSTHQRI